MNAPVAAASEVAAAPGEMIVQLGLASADDRADFRSELRAWAAQSPFVSAQAEDDHSQDAEPYWNLHLGISDIEGCWAALSPVIERFETPFRAQLAASIPVDATEFPATIVVATNDLTWADYLELYNAPAPDSLAR